MFQHIIDHHKKILGDYTKIQLIIITYKLQEL